MSHLIKRYERSCKSKRRYKTKAKATEIRRHMEMKYPGNVLQVYQCDFCGCWHIGHPPKDEQSLIRVQQAIVLARIKPK